MKIFIDCQNEFIEDNYNIIKNMTESDFESSLKSDYYNYIQNESYFYFKDKNIKYDFSDADD